MSVFHTGRARRHTVAGLSSAALAASTLLAPAMTASAADDGRRAPATVGTVSTVAPRYASAVSDSTVPVRQADGSTVRMRTELPARARPESTVAAPRTAASTYPVKLSIKADYVQSKWFYVWNRKTWMSYAADNSDGYNPTSTVRLPPGDYFAVAMYASWNQTEYLLTSTFTVGSAARTVPFDQRAAKETAIRVDDPSAVRQAASAWISVPDGHSAGDAGGWGKKIYVTPFSVPGVSLRLHEILGKKGSSASVPSPYRYDLTHSFTGTATASPITTVRTSSLAKTVTKINAPGTRTPAYLATTPSYDDSSGGGLSSDVPVGGSLTEYVTPGIPYYRDLSNGTSTLDLPSRTLAAGTNASETLGAAPLQPIRSRNGGSERYAGKMRLHEKDVFSDAAGHQGFDGRATYSYKLTGSNGVTYAQADGLGPWNALTTTLLPESTKKYTLTQAVHRRVPSSRLSTDVRSEWTFRSESLTALRELPLIDTLLTVPGLNEYGRAAAGPVLIEPSATARAEGTAAKVTGLAYSTDDGTTWTDLPLAADGSTTLTVPATAAFVSLRVTATDDQGGSLRRTITRAFAGPAPQGDEQVGAVRVSGIVLNAGKPVKLTDATEQEFTARFTATDPAGIARGGMHLYKGSYDTPDAVLRAYTPATCTEVDVTTATCEVRFTGLNPRRDLGRNSLAGAWKIAAWAESKDGTSYTDLHAAKTVSVLHDALLTTDATPEPVAKGRPLTITGKLSSANWETTTGGYPGLAGAKVTLQFRKAGTSAYTSVKTVTTDRSGNLKTTVKATSDGYWRYTFPGSPVAAPITAEPDYVDVR